MSEFEIPIAITEVATSHFANYAGFPVENEADDAQLKSYGEVTITNISFKDRAILDITLIIEGAGVKLRQAADLRGPFGWEYGRDDQGARSASERGRPLGKFFKNPIELEPQHHMRANLVFVFAFGSESRTNISNIMLRDQDFDFYLEVHDHISGLTNWFRLPGMMRASNPG